MSTKYWDNLNKYIVEASKNHSLDDLYFSTFIWQMDNKTQMSAADVVYALSAILESPSKVKSDNFTIDMNLLEEVEEQEFEDLTA